MPTFPAFKGDGGMDFRMLSGPIYAAACAAIAVGAVAFARSEARQTWRGQPLAWGAVAAVVLAFFASRLGLAPAELLSRTSFMRGVALFALGCSAVALMLAFKARSRASACYQARPLSVDEAISALRAGQATEGVFEGQVSCEEPVTSPGGIVCVAYEAQLREPRVDGARGSLRSLERAYAHVLHLKGERQSAALLYHPGSLVAKEEIRRCRLSQRAPFAPSTVLASGEVATEALSYEKVLRMGEKCRVVGKLEPGVAKGSYRIKGIAGQPPLVLVGEEVSAAGRRFFRSALAHFAASAVLCLAAAWLLRM